MPNDTLTLTDFLLARIAEDEVRATLREWHAEDCEHLPDPSGYTYPCDCGVPERLRAECEAKRRIVELRYSWNLQAEREPEPPFGPILKTQVVTADAVIRTLTSVYADHPDYRAEWSA